MSEALQDEVAAEWASPSSSSTGCLRSSGRAWRRRAARAGCTSGTITTSPRSWIRSLASGCRTARWASWSLRAHQGSDADPALPHPRPHILTREPCPCGRTSARIGKILGRTDDMLIVRGVNVFPSQIEHALISLPGLAPHYQLVLTTRADRQDELGCASSRRPLRSEDGSRECWRRWLATHCGRAGAGGVGGAGAPGPDPAQRGQGGPGAQPALPAHGSVMARQRSHPPPAEHCLHTVQQSAYRQLNAC